MFNILSIGAGIGYAILIVLLVVVMGLIIFYLADLIVAIFTRGKGKETVNEVYAEPVLECAPTNENASTEIANENFFGELEPKKEEVKSIPVDEDDEEDFDFDDDDDLDRKYQEILKQIESESEENSDDEDDFDIDALIKKRREEVQKDVFPTEIQDKKEENTLTSDDRFDEVFAEINNLKEMIAAQNAASVEESESQSVDAVVVSEANIVKETNELNETITRLEAEKAALSVDFAREQDRNAELEAELTKNAKTIEELKAQNEDYAKLSEQASKDLEEALISVESLKKEVIEKDEAIKENEALKAQIEELTTKVDALSSENSTLIIEKEVLSNGITEITEALNSEKEASVNNQFDYDNIAQENKKLIEEQTTITNEIASLQADLIALNKEKDELATLNKENEEKLDRANADIADITAQKDELVAKLDSQNQEVANIQDKFMKFVEEQETATKELNLKIEQLTQEKFAIETECNDKTNNINELTEALENGKAEYEAVVAENNNLVANNEVLTQAVDSLTTQVAELTVKAESLEDDSEGQDVVVLKEDNKKLAEAIEELKEENKKLKEESVEIDSEEIESLKEEVEALKEENKTLRAENKKKAKASNEDMTAETYELQIQALEQAKNYAEEQYIVERDARELAEKKLAEGGFAPANDSDEIKVLKEQLEEYKSSIEAIQRDIADEKIKREEVETLLSEEKAAKEALEKQIEETKVKFASLEAEKNILETQVVYVDNQDEEESKESLQNRLNILTERLKDAEKELKNNKKEYLPLARIKKTFESDQAKLRRKEAIVAKQKISLFGVNNYVVDPEKEQKLNDELDALEALRLSVEHCETVLKDNEDRLPILEKTYNILTKNVNDLKMDIEAINKKLQQND